MKNRSISNKEKKQPGASGASGVKEVFFTALKLGLTSFGGPVAHLGYFYNEFVKKKGWLTDRGYAELTALCQLLPGPSSSQFSIAVGIMRAGFRGGIASWLGFTLPSAVLMICFGIFMQGASFNADAGWLNGLKIVAVAIVAQAVLQMGQKLAPDGIRAAFAIFAAGAALLVNAAAGHIIIIAAAGIAGALLFREQRESAAAELPEGGSVRQGTVLLALFFFLLILLPAVRQFSDNILLSLADGFYRAGALVFGGGHVILPLLEREVVPGGLVTPEGFLAGYGAAQAVPGPLFTFAGYLGLLSGGMAGAITALGAIFLPAFFLIAGALPFWERMKSIPRVAGAVSGINASVVGILLAALYQPLWTSSIKSSQDFALAAALYGMLAFRKVPPWAVVLTGASAGFLLKLPW
jgi:chromate transporter